MKINKNEYRCRKKGKDYRIKKEINKQFDLNSFDIFIENITREKNSNAKYLRMEIANR